MPPAECSLEIMLAARDRRRGRQAEHFSRPDAPTLLVATVVAPGKFKLTPRTMKVAEALRQALRESFAGSILSMDSIDPVSGPETWITLSMSPEDAKARAVCIEDTHPLGRLFDFDIISPDLEPLSRTLLGHPPRKCLLCDNDARVCMRSATHSHEEVISFITDLIDTHFK